MVSFLIFNQNLFAPLTLIYSIENRYHRLRTGCVKAGSATSASQGRQFLEYYHPWRYSDDVKQLCIKMYLNGMGLRGIERVTDIHHTKVMGWIKEAGSNLKDVPETDEEPEITDKR